MVKLFCEGHHKKLKITRIEKFPLSALRRGNWLTHLEEKSQKTS
jgi:hypothetical protein